MEGEDITTSNLRANMLPYQKQIFLSLSLSLDCAIPP